MRVLKAGTRFQLFAERSEQGTKVMLWLSSEGDPFRRLRRRLAVIGFVATLFFTLASPAKAWADFGIKELSTKAINADKTIDLQAGSHPFEFEVALAMNQDGEAQPEGTLRDLIVDLPPGMAGNPLAVRRCDLAQFEGPVAQCPGNTQVGIAKLAAGAEDILFTVPIFNLVAPLGVAARIGFTAFDNNGFLDASLRTGSDYGITVSDITVPTNVRIRTAQTRIWGVPADKSHDAERYCEGGDPPCSTDATPAPFLSLPTSCTGPLETTLHVDSVENPGLFEEASTFSLNEDGEEAGLENCEAPPFDPTITSQPETAVSDSPTGLHFHLKIPQNEDPKGLATAHLRDTVLTLPAGMAVNASAAIGRSACSSAQIDLHGPGAANCPPASKLGTVTIEAPAIDHPVKGAIYLASQGDNPFNSLLALYIAVDDPQSGVIVKLAGRVDPDPVTGQLTTTFKENPQLPFEEVDVNLPGGPRAPLTTPPTCPPKPPLTNPPFTTEATLTPWSAPEGKVALGSDSFPITSAPGGGPCPGSEAAMPNSPSFEAGTQTPQAGAFSPFVLKLARENGSERFAALNVTLPPGLSAKLAGTSECSEAQIAQAQARSKPGQGALEQSAPSCPSSSEIGIVNVGAGSANPFYAQGHAYLAAPYKGAPLSLAIITPAVAGPFDLGVVVVRSALYVDQSSAQVTVKSDPIPQILQGIPLDVRSVAVQVNRPDFSLNPTNCEPMAVGGQLFSSTGAAALLSSRFQVGGCGGLDFGPKLTLSLKGGTKRARHPALKAVLTQPSGQANIARTSVALPPTEFIDQNHISNPCTRPQFAAGTCPSGSVLGKARAFSPLLEAPLEGKVYFRANGGARKLPDIVADLNGKIHIVLVGFLDSIHKKGSESSRVRTTFATVPDAPVSKFVLELKGGKKGTLVNSTNICKVPNTASVKMKAQNGKAKDFNLRIRTSCSR